MKITKEWLKKHGACAEGVRFFECNFPNGLDTDKVTVTGDFNEFWEWLNGALDCAYEYDDNGNRIKTVDPSGEVYTYEYDNKDNMIKTVAPNGDVWRYEYDDNGNRIKSVTPNGNVYTYEYDDNGNLIKEVYPDGRVWRFEYDDNGNRIKKVSLYGHVWGYEYRYDGSGRLISIAVKGRTVAEIAYHD